MANSKKNSKTSSAVRRGRPQSYPLTSNQVRAIRSRLDKGLSAAKIATELDVHEYAVLRIRRGSDS